MSRRIKFLSSPACLGAVAIVAATALTIAAPARADLIDFFLNQPECTGTGSACSPPATIPNSSAVQVDINRTSTTTAIVTFTGPGTSNINAPALLNVSGSFQASSTEGLAPASPCGFGITACATGNEDQFGTMDLETGSAAAHTIIINLTAENGNTWASAAAVVTPTTNFNSKYGHGFEATTAAQDAGLIVTTNTAVAPEPSTIALLGAGLVALGFIRRRHRPVARS